jgi:hypothetical protein
MSVMKEWGAKRVSKAPRKKAHPQCCRVAEQLQQAGCVRVSLLQTQERAVATSQVEYSVLIDIALVRDCKLLTYMMIDIAGQNVNSRVLTQLYVDRYRYR